MNNKRHIELIDVKYNEAIFKFSCGSKYEHFENYLRMEAYADYEDGLGTTHLFLEDTDDYKGILLGFYTLRNSSLVFNEIDEGVRIGLPAIEILEFATHKDYRRQGIGRIMIEDIIAQVSDLNNISSANNIILCARKDAVGFYEKMEFYPVDDKERFIPRVQGNKNCIPMVRNIIYKHK